MKIGPVGKEQIRASENSGRKSNENKARGKSHDGLKPASL